MPQHVMITAGGSGIGLAIAKAFADNGAKVHVCDVDGRALGEVAKEHPEIADMCLFLTSSAAGMVTGQAIAVDGHTETFHIGV